MKTNALMHPALMFHTTEECLSILRDATRELREEGEKVEACAHLVFFNLLFKKKNENRNTQPKG